MDEWEEMEEWSGMRRREKAEANKEEKNGKRITALCSDRKGSSMVLVMCVLMAVLILCSALLLESASLASVVYRERSGERCRILAESVSRSLEKELVNRPYRWKMGTRSNAEAERSTYSNAKRLSGAGDGSLWEYVGTHIDSADGSWPDYDPESPDRYARSRARRTFRLSEEASGWPKEAGEVKVCLYWVKEGSGAWMDSDELEDGEDGENLDIALYVETTCTRRKESCTVTKVYYKWKKEDGSGRQEDSWQWVTGAERRAAHGTNEGEEMEETNGTSSLPQRKYHR